MCDLTKLPPDKPKKGAYITLSLLIEVVRGEVGLKIILTPMTANKTKADILILVCDLGYALESSLELSCFRLCGGMITRCLSPSAVLFGDCPNQLLTDNLR